MKQGFNPMTNFVNYSLYEVFHWNKTDFDFHQCKWIIIQMHLQNI